MFQETWGWRWAMRPIKRRGRRSPPELDALSFCLPYSSMIASPISFLLALSTPLYSFNDPV